MLTLALSKRSPGALSILTQVGPGGQIWATASAGYCMLPYASNLTVTGRGQVLFAPPLEQYEPAQGWTNHQISWSVATTGWFDNPAPLELDCAISDTGSLQPIDPAVIDLDPAQIVRAVQGAQPLVSNPQGSDP